MAETSPTLYYLFPEFPRNDLNPRSTPRAGSSIRPAFPHSKKMILCVHRELGLPFLIFSAPKSIAEVFESRGCDGVGLGGRCTGSLRYSLHCAARIAKSIPVSSQLCSFERQFSLGSWRTCFAIVMPARAVLYVVFIFGTYTVS
jgi:hypothetical protein